VSGCSASIACLDREVLEVERDDGLRVARDGGREDVSVFGVVLHRRLQ
jgi:hypothetical protein